MKTKIIFYLLGIFILAACGNQPKVPSNNKTNTNSDSLEESHIDSTIDYNRSPDNYLKDEKVKKELTISSTKVDSIQKSEKKQIEKTVIQNTPVVKKEEIKIVPKKVIKEIKAMGIQTIKPSDFKNSYSNNKSILIDVRTPSEFNNGHLPGAINIDYYSSNFQNKIDKLDKSKAYSIYCKSGGRSYNAAQKMIKSGLPTVYNLDGGIRAWNKNNYPIE